MNRATVLGGEAFSQALKRITWHTAGLTLAISLAFDVWSFFEGFRGESAYQGYLSGTILNLLVAFATMFATFIADEFVSRGTSPTAAYTSAVIAGSALAALLHQVLSLWLPRPSEWAEPLLPAAAIGLRAFLEYLVWGGIGVAIYAYWRAALLAAGRLSDAQLNIANTRRRTLESRLLALQTRIDPSFISQTLQGVSDAYDRDAAAGSAALEGLIRYLRAVPLRQPDVGSALGQELHRLHAYFDIAAKPLRLITRISSAAARAHVPAMILQPLLDSIAVRSESVGPLKVKILARKRASSLCVVLAADGGATSSADDAALEPVRQRLISLYGAHGKLSDWLSSRSGLTIVFQVPYECPHRIDR